MASWLGGGNSAHSRHTAPLRQRSEVGGVSQGLLPVPRATSTQCSRGGSGSGPIPAAPSSGLASTASAATQSTGAAGAGSGGANCSSYSSASAAGGGAAKSSKKRERWLVTRKTWRYMADAGKLLIPEALRKGKDIKDYSADDLNQLDEHYQKVCNQQKEFVIWEGPLEDPRILLARNRVAAGAAELMAARLGAAFHAQAGEAKGEDAARLADGLSGESGQDRRKQQDLAAATGALKKTKKKAGGGRRRSSTKVVGPRLGRAGSIPTSAAAEPLGKAAGARGGFMPSPYGTGMLNPFTSGGALSASAASGGATDAGSTASGLAHREALNASSAAGAAGVATAAASSMAPPDYSFLSHSAKFRILLPSGEKPPEGYTQVGKRMLPVGDLPDYAPPTSDSFLQLPSGLLLQELPAAYSTDTDRDWFSRRSSSVQDSGVLSPMSPDELDPASFEPDPEHSSRHNESGIGSGADSVGGGAMHTDLAPSSHLRKKVSVPIQTEPLPEEFVRLEEEERRKKEEEERRKEEELRLAREAEERAKREEEELEASIMGDSVMRYLKMVRRNSKSADQKKADRFRSMNYDPTLRNIKAKYLVTEDHIEGMKHAEIQAGESLIHLLKRCQTPIDPKPDTYKRKLSQAASDFSDSNIGSPARRLSEIPGLLPEEPLVPGSDAERDFFAHLYSGELGADGNDGIPEDYYNYLESWYRAQKSLQPGLLPTPSSVAPSATGKSTSVPGFPRSTSANTVASSSPHTGLYIPVSALQNLRASMPALSGAGGSTTTLASTSGALGTSAPTVSEARSTSSLASSTPKQSFLSSVISSAKPLAAGLSGQGQSHQAASSRMLSRKLWQRSRSKSQTRVTNASAWTPQVHCRWTHSSSRSVLLEASHLLLLHDFERAALQKVALNKLNKADLGTIIRIPKEFSDKGEAKGKKRGYLLKKRVLKKDKEKEHKRDPSSGPSSGSSNPVFGVPLSQCVEQTPGAAAAAAAAAAASSAASTTSSSVTRKRSTTSDIQHSHGILVIEGPEILSPASTSSISQTGLRSESRTSIGSIVDTIKTDKTTSSLVSAALAGSCDSLNFDYRGAGPGGLIGASGSNPRRRSSVGQSQASVFDALSLSAASGILDDDPSGSSFPNVPPIVMMCIRHLEQYGLRTVGIFRVSSSKKRVRQLREDFDNGGDIIFNEDIAVHDVATLLKEFFRDLPEPLIPKELIPGLLAAHKLSGSQDQLLVLQRLIQLLPQVNRDTLFVLLHFLGLVAENAEDRTLSDGSTEPGNRMDATNLATLFAPNLLHAFMDEPALVPSSASKSSGFAPAAIISAMPAKQTTERMEFVSAIRLLIEKRDTIFELPAEELHDVYLYLWEAFPEVLDVLLRRRCALAGQELLEDDEELESQDDNRRDVLGAIGGGFPCSSSVRRPASVATDVNIPLHHTNSRLTAFLNKAKGNNTSTSVSSSSSLVRQRSRSRAVREGSECSMDGSAAQSPDARTAPPTTSSTQSTGSSWFRFRERSEHSSDGTASEGNRWGFGRSSRRDKSHESQSKAGSRPPSADEGGGHSSSHRGSLRFHVPSRRSGSSTTPCSPEQLHSPLASPPPSDPPRRNAESGRGIDSVVYSPASSTSARGTPSSEMFFGSGNTTPSLVTSPPPSSFSHGFNSPNSFSPPISPPPLQPVLQPQRLHQPENLVSKRHTIIGNPPLVLQPVPDRRSPLPSAPTTAVVSSLAARPVTSREAFLFSSPSSDPPQSFPAMTNYSLLSPRNGASGGGGGGGSSIGTLGADGGGSRSDLDSEATPRATPSREPKKYVRRRYTDSRHPTKELPDVRLEVPESMTVQNPPIRKSQKIKTTTVGHNL